MEFTDLLAQATPPQRTVQICLRGDLVAQWEETARQLAKTKERDPGASLAGTGAGALARDLERLTAEMEPFTVPFLLRGLSRPAYKALEAAHPPRQGPDGKVLTADADDGVNVDTFWYALVRACVISPQVTGEQWAELFDQKLSDGQVNQLASAALLVSRGTVDVPFFSAVSAHLASSGNGSSPRSDSASASSGSTAGSLATPPPATTREP